jgi:hypothetical protein
MQSTVDGVTTSYSLDLAGGLTQVLADGDSTYLYGLGRIGEEGAGGWQYHLQNTMQKPHGILTCGGMRWAPCTR